ncbi:winged helix-turn-helix transcriptional regulator [Candidatus Woesearchaeota archaeon]|nr:winged helix-turn-helix transcriptional regulator [Candidatus Woesearchaeota archaeon]
MLKQKLVKDDPSLNSIRSFLTRTKQSGDKIGMIELMSKFNCPPQKINRIMRRLEKEGVIREEEW